MAEVSPRGSRVLVKVLDSNDSPSGIVIPNGVRPYPDRGVVVRTGPGYRQHDGEYISLDLSPGDEVIFFARNGIEILWQGEKLILLQDEHILMKTTDALVPAQ